MERNILSCGQALVRLLERYGVSTVFGIPGTHTLELYRGLDGSSIRHVLARHEQGAAFMADGYARSTGRPGVCFLITGPGVTNAATAIAQAYSDSQPLLIISSVNSIASLGKGWGEVHELDDQRASTKPFTAFSATALTPDEIPGLIARAFSIFCSERPRPVHIEIPIDVFELPITSDWTTYERPAPPAPNLKTLQAAATLLQSAENPIIVVGGGASDAGAPIIEIADRLAAPVLPTVAANGVVPDNHDLCIGPRFWAQPVSDMIRSADVVLAIGTELSVNEGCTPEPMEIPGKLIRVDIDPKKLVDRIPAEIAIWADASQAAQALASILPEPANHVRRARAAKAVSDVRETSDNSLSELQAKHTQVADILQDTLPSSTFFATDMTQIAYTTRGTMGFNMPRRMLNPKGYGTLGYALPAAIGARIANPEVPVVAIAGDSGVMYTIQEMATATENAARIILIIWNNQSLAEIRDGFINLGVKPTGVAPYTPDFVALSQAMDWNATKVRDARGLRDALKVAMESNRSTMIEVAEEGSYDT